VVRLIPGVIGNPESLTEESHAVGQDGLLEYPVYTKPPSWRGLEVPPVLFSGHHAQIAAWRREQALARTAERRPDLLPVDVDRVDIDAARPADAAELLTLQRAAFVTEGRLNHTWDIPPLTQTLAELADSLGSGLTLVARRGGRLVGSVRGEETADGAWYVGRLMVAPDLQGHGLGSRLMGEIEARLPEDCTVIRLLTGARSGPNLGFYARRGYREVSRSTRGEDIEVVLMEKAAAGSG
jgi:tRNA (guanine37-N1)-methyltransferase